MSIDQYKTRLTVLSYKTYKKAKAKKIPYSVYLTIYYLFSAEARRYY